MFCHNKNFVVVHDRRGNLLYKIKVDCTNMFVKINCPECGGSGIWNFYPEEYGAETSCINCKSTGKTIVDLY